jgi:RHS repeat-associated protein
MTEANGDYTDYGYDNVYELTSEVMKDSGGTTIYSISWTYDNVGNRGTQTKDGNQTSYTYNNMNQMTAAGNITFTYDSNGNTASKTESRATTNYNWDYEKRLTKIDNPSGDDYVYEYDGDGMRARSGHDSGQGNVWETRFYYDTAAPLYSYLFESDNDKTMTVAYTTDPGARLISQRRGGATYYHLYDRLGSTRQLLNSNQTTTDTYSYYAFGDVRSSSGSTSNPFKFVGQLGYYDDPLTEFQYLRARYYAPPYGRFMNPDAVTRDQTQYAYGSVPPTVGVDPSGAFTICMATTWSWAGTRERPGHGRWGLADVSAKFIPEGSETSDIGLCIVTCQYTRREFWVIFLYYYTVTLTYCWDPLCPGPPRGSIDTDAQLLSVTTVDLGWSGDSATLYYRRMNRQSCLAVNDRKGNRIREKAKQDCKRKMPRD